VHQRGNALNKLSKFKEWLTVTDAAEYLSIVFGEVVSEADVLRFALDGHLRLSVYFVNHAKAHSGKIVRYTAANLEAAITSGNLPKDLKWHEWPPGAMAALRPDLPPDEAEKLNVMLMSLRIGEDRYITLSDQVSTLKGVWDLPMIGNERLDIEHEFQNLSGGPDVTLQGLDGAFVEGPDGQICQLLESFDQNEFQDGSTANLDKLKQTIRDQNIDEPEAMRLLNIHKEKRKIFLEKESFNRESSRHSNNHYPASGLPKDSVLVVRTNALREFEKRINDDSAGEKALSTTERNTLLIIIEALCRYTDIKSQERGTAPKIVSLTHAVGAAVGDDTVRDVLKQIPKALETRMK
jgi:hypothetical protein